MSLQAGPPREAATCGLVAAGLKDVAVAADLVTLEGVGLLFAGVLTGSVIDVRGRAVGLVERNISDLYADVEGRVGRGWESTGACPKRFMTIRDKAAVTIRLGTGLDIDFYTVRPGNMAQDTAIEGDFIGAEVDHWFGGVRGLCKKRVFCIYL